MNASLYFYVCIIFPQESPMYVVPIYVIMLSPLAHAVHLFISYQYYLWHGGSTQLIDCGVAIEFTSLASAASLQTPQFFYQQIAPSVLGQHPRIPLQRWTDRLFRLDPQVLPQF